MAALLVVCDHAAQDFVRKAGGIADIGLGGYLGDLGVAAFFVISGFVMIYAHGKDFGVPGTPATFYARRINRIVPIYWLITIGYALYLTHQHRGPTIMATIGSMLFVPFQGAGDAYGHPVLGQGWTLNYEVIFYLVFGAALLLRRGVWLVFAIFIAWVGLQSAGLLGENNPAAFWGRGIVLYFLGGIAIGLLKQQVSTGLEFHATLLAAAAVLAIAVAAAILAGPGAPVAILLEVIAALASVALCAWAAETRQTSPIRTIAKALGDATYSIYLTHTLVIGPAAAFVGRHAPHLPFAAFATIMLACCSIVGLLAYRFVERPLMKIWGRAFSAAFRRQDR